MLDNLRNLGHPDPEYHTTKLCLKGNFDELLNELNRLYVKVDFHNKKTQEDLESSRRSKISLNLFPPSKFKHIDLILNCEDQLKRENAFQDLTHFARSFNSIEFNQ